MLKISLAQWSLHRSIFNGELDNLDFARYAKNQFDIEAVEYVNRFFIDKDFSYIKEMKKRADDAGVKSLLIMCDDLGRLGEPDPLKRKEAVQNHFKWVEYAKILGCFAIRVNAASEGSYEDQMKYAADGLSQLTALAEKNNMNVLVENHGGLSSSGAWLSNVIKLVDHPLCGTLPDFGNFRLSEDEEYDRYLGLSEMLPFAKGLSAKSYDFDKDGNETTIDYFKMMKIVADSGYSGYIGIEYEGNRLSEIDGITATKSLLRKTMTK